MSASRLSLLTLKFHQVCVDGNAFFAAAPEDTNGKPDAGRKLLLDMEDVIQKVRSRQVATKLKDDEGESAGLTTRVDHRRCVT